MSHLKDYATSIVVTPPSPSNSGTSLTISEDTGIRMPDVPFYATAHPSGSMPTIDNAEKIQVTAINGDTLTIVRGLSPTTAKNIDTGWMISNTLFSSDIHDPVTISGEDFLSLDGQNLTANKLNLDNLSATGTPSDSKFLRGDNTWSEISSGSGGYASNTYLTGQVSTIVGTYKRTSYINDSTSTEFSATVNNNEVLIATFLNESTVGVSLIDAGTWDFHPYGKVSSTAGSSQLKFEIFKRDSSGVETTLFYKYSGTISNTTYGRIADFSTYQDQISLDTTDRIGVRVYAKNTVAASVTVYFETGDDTATYLNTPLALRHTQLRGLNDDTSHLHVTDAEKASWSSKANSGANSDITSIAGLTTALSTSQGGTGKTSFVDGTDYVSPSTGILSSTSHKLTTTSTAPDNPVSGDIWINTSNINPYCPTGSILDFAGSTTPDGWLICDGSAISRTTYAALFTVISTTFGSGDGSTTFNLPDLRRKVTVGSGGTGTTTLGNAVGNHGGEESHQLSESELPNITAVFSLHGQEGGTGVYTISGHATGSTYSNGYKAPPATTSGANSIVNPGISFGSNGSHNNIQPSLIMNKIIKV